MQMRIEGMGCVVTDRSLHCAAMRAAPKRRISPRSIGLVAMAVCVVAFFSACARTPLQIVDDALNHPDPDTRAKSYLLLANSPFGSEDEYVQMYNRMGTAESDAQVRAAAVHALGLHGGPIDVEVLATIMIEDSNPYVRWQAALSLQRIHNLQAIDALTQAMNPAKELSADVRMAAAYAIGQYFDSARENHGVVFESLIGALDDHDYGVVRTASISLQTLTGVSGPDLINWTAKEKILKSGNYHVGVEDAWLWKKWAAKHQGRLFEGHNEYSWQDK